MALIFIKPQKEYAYRRLSTKRQFGTDKSHHCSCLIEKGDHYIEDYISKIVRNRSGQGCVLWFVYKVCENHWIAPLNV